MPKGPKGQKRPADVIGNAVKVMKLDISKASKALADYKLRGGVTLEQLKKQLGLDKK